jgi:hypothetical protein
MVQALAWPGNEESMPARGRRYPSIFAYVNLIRGFAPDEKFKLFMAAISSVYRRLPSLPSRSIL